MEKKLGSGGALCGGVISQSAHEKNVEKYGVWADTMSYVMPDEHHQKYIECKQAGRSKEADALFRKYAISQI